jgi:hypothetical protein
MESNGMVYVRVLRAIAATNGGGQSSLEELTNRLNEEFAILGVRIRPEDLKSRQSALDIAGMISRKIQ